jgi:hypothetical protein
MIGARKSERKNMEKQAWTIGESVVVKPGVGSVRTQTSSWQNGSLSDMLMEKATRSHKE